MSFTRAASIDDVWSGEKLGVVVDGARILLVNVDGVVRAFEDRCAHRSVALSDGRLDGAVLTCPAHEWTYDARTGRGINPRAASLCSVPVRIEANEILVDPSSLVRRPRAPAPACAIKSEGEGP